MTKPKLSIIIPVWNTGKTVETIVESIISQKFDDFELILVDDGSTDETLSIIKELEKSDKRIRVYTKPNGGPSSARNIGLEKATGEFIQFYDADDNISGDAISITTSAIEKTNSSLLVSGWQIDLNGPNGLVENYKQVNPKPKTIDSNIIENVLRSLGNDGTLYNLWNKMFKANIIKDNDIRFKEDLRFGEDLLFALEYLKHAKSIEIIPDITYQYRVSSTGEFGKSSLVPEYRVANDEGAVEFAGADLSREDKDLLNWLRTRWQLSYWSLVAGSDKSFREKREAIKAFRPKNIRLIKSPRYIGAKHWLINIAVTICRKSILLSLTAGFATHSAKRFIKLVKLSIRTPRPKL